MRAVVGAAGVGALLSLAMAGCSGAVTVHHTHPYCYPASECSTVTVVVEQCGGPPPGKCRVVPVTTVSLFDTHGKLVGRESAGTGHKARSFSFMEPIHGRYVFEATIDGHRVQRTVTLRLGQTVSVKLIDSVS